MQDYNFRSVYLEVCATCIHGKFSSIGWKCSVTHAYSGGVPTRVVGEDIYNYSIMHHTCDAWSLGKVLVSAY